jgi:hypothetical protein
VTEVGQHRVPRMLDLVADREARGQFRLLHTGEFLLPSSAAGLAVSTAATATNLSDKACKEQATAACRR